MKLLLAIDVHDRHQEMFRDAAVWARRLGATLDLVYVNSLGAYLPHLQGPVLTAELQTELERVRAQEANQLEARMGELPEENRGAIHLLTGDPASSVVDLAPAYDALVVATHGRTGLAHLWMGSIAEQIVRRAPVPVIVLRMEPQPS